MRGQALLRGLGRAPSSARAWRRRTQPRPPRPDGRRQTPSEVAGFVRSTCLASATSFGVSAVALFLSPPAAVVYRSVISRLLLLSQPTSTTAPADFVGAIVIL